MDEPHVPQPMMRILLDAGSMGAMVCLLRSPVGKIVYKTVLGYKALHRVEVKRQRWRLW